MTGINPSIRNRRLGLILLGIFAVLAVFSVIFITARSRR